MPRGVTNDLATLARIARTHLNRAKALGASLDQRMKIGARQANARGEAWVPDDTWRADFNQVTQATVQAGNALHRALEGNAKKLGGMSTEQLEAQFKAELLRAAAHFTAEDWARLDQVRMKQVIK